MNERKNKSGKSKKAIGIAMAAIIVTSIFATFAPALVARDVPPGGDLAVYWLDPENSGAAHFCESTTVDVWVNSTVQLFGGDFTVTTSNPSCGDINISSYIGNQTDFFNHAVQPNSVPGQMLHVRYWTNGWVLRNPGEYHIGNFTVHCNSTDCCDVNLDFTRDVPWTYITNTTGDKNCGGYPGTFNCSAGNFSTNVSVEKFVKYEAEPNSAYRKVIDDAEPGDDVTYKIAIQNNGSCKNLTNINVTDVLNCSLNYTAGSASEPPASVVNNCPDNRTITWNIAGWLEPGNWHNITFDAHVDYCGNDSNYVNVSALNETGYGVNDEDTVWVNKNIVVDMEINKTVWDGANWVNGPIVKNYGDNVMFKLWVHNNGTCCNFTGITIWDNMTASLNFTNASIDPDYVDIPVNETVRWDTSLGSLLPLAPCENITIIVNATVEDVGHAIDTNWLNVTATPCTGPDLTDSDSVEVRISADLNVTRIDVNRDIEYLRIGDDRGQGEVAFGPTNHPGYKTQCNNISAIIEEENGMATSDFNVSFKVDSVELCNNTEPGMAANEVRTVWCNNSWYPLVGNYTVNVTADCNNTITESDETNNLRSRAIRAVQHGLKGNHYQDGRNISKMNCDEGQINLTYSVGDSEVLSGYNNKWGTYMNYTANWTASNLTIPVTATIKKARLYAYYNFDRTPAQNVTDYFTMYFNDQVVSPVEHYNDRKNPSGFGSSGAGGTFPMNSYNFKYGMLAYNVTSLFNAGGNNASLNNTEPSDPHHVAMTGMLLVVVYEDPCQPGRVICINEGFDMLKSGIWFGRHVGVDSTEATTYANFTNENIAVGEMAKATLVTITNHAQGDGDDHLYFNGQLLGSESWLNMGATEVCNNETEVLPLLLANDNAAAYQSDDDGFEATNAFLIAEKDTTANISIDPERTLTQPQDQFDVNISIKPGSTGVFGVQYTLKYNNSVLKAESQVPRDFFGDNDSIVVINKIDQAKGEVYYAETLRNDTSEPCERTPGTLTTIQFTAIGAANTTSILNLTDVIIIDCCKEEIEYLTENGTAHIFSNPPPEITCVNSTHEKNNAQKKFECWTELCVNITDGGEKGYNISYVRWSFGDGQYGTTEGGLPCNPKVENCCLCKDHSYIMWEYNASCESVMPRPDHNGQPHKVCYDPLNASVTVTDDGCIPATDTEFFDVWVFMTGDANGDSKVNILDAVWIGKHFGDHCDGPAATGATHCAGNCGYMWSTNQKSGADLNNDCVINILDAVIVGTMWGHTAY